MEVVIALLVIGFILYVAVEMGLIDNDRLQRLVHIASIIGVLAAVIVFIIPVARNPEQISLMGPPIETQVTSTGAVVSTEPPLPSPTSPIPPTEAAISPTEAAIPPTEAVIPPTEALIRPTEAAILPTEVPIPPTELPIPPTVTAIPPTVTAIPPTATAMPPTATAEPPTETFSQKVGEDGMVLLYVPAGEFLMGDDDSGFSNQKPQHTVYLDAFWIDQTEVTNEMYKPCVEAGVCRAPSLNRRYNNQEYSNYPVTYVSWQDARTYCQWAGRRLPTEAQWEKAARGTDGRIYPWGNQSPTRERVNFCDKNCPFDWKDESVDDGYADGAPVGSYPTGASPYGALDMSGNVWEWVADWHDENYYNNSPYSNPQGPDNEESRTMRGGSWRNEKPWVSASFRFQWSPTEIDYDWGFRCIEN